MSVKVGSETMNLADELPQDSQTINLRYDPNILQPIFVKRVEFEEIAEAVGMGAIVKAKPDQEKEAKKFHKYQRLAGQPVGKLLHRLVTSPEFLTGDGILLALPKAETKAETPVPTETPKEKVKGKA